MTRTFLLAAALLGSFAARADSRIDCREHAEVGLGMSLDQVLAKCGPATSAVQRIEQRQPLSQGDCCCTPPQRVVIDTLKYDLGPDRFVRILKFEDGVLLEISTGWYGAG